MVTYKKQWEISLKTDLKGACESDSPEVDGLGGIELVKLSELEIKILSRKKLSGHTQFYYHP